VLACETPALEQVGLVEPAVGVEGQLRPDAHLLFALRLGQLQQGCHVGITEGVSERRRHVAQSAGLVNAASYTRQATPDRAGFPCASERFKQASAR
jgi:hypothetical protein